MQTTAPDGRTIEINHGDDIRPGWNIQRRGFAGHKPTVIIYCTEDGRAKIRHSTETPAAARRWIRYHG